MGKLKSIVALLWCLATWRSPAIVLDEHTKAIRGDRVQLPLWEKKDVK
jgi:hypothetical protein